MYNEDDDNNEENEDDDNNEENEDDVFKNGILI